MHERTGMHELAYMLLLLAAVVAASWLLLLAAAQQQPATAAATSGSSQQQQQQQPEAAPAATSRFMIRGTYSCTYKPGWRIETKFQFKEPPVNFKWNICGLSSEFY
jgi:hypothetical protein